MNATLTARTLVLAATLLTAVGSPLSAWAQGTAFTYQGRLNDSGQPATGVYDLRFTIYDASGGGGVVAGPLTNATTLVSNGLFTVTLDFGVGVFTGAERWLDIAVRTNGVGAFAALAPRQRLNAAPYAILAGNVSGTVAAAQIDPAIARATDVFPTVVANDGSGSGLDADRLDGLSAEDFWRVGGNAGTTPGAQFVGTTDSQPLEFKVSNLRALRLELNGGDAPNLIGGAPDNTVAASVRGATIAGGKVNFIGTNAHLSVVGGGGNNSVGDNSVSATIAGGYANTVASGSATIAGGEGNIIRSNGLFSTIGGGRVNFIVAARSTTIAGGEQNSIGTNASYSAVGGGYGNDIESGSSQAVVAGGYLNNIGANANYSAIGGGNGNTVASGSTRATIAGGELNEIGGSAGYSSIGGGYRNVIATNSSYATIAGGMANDLGTNADYSAIGGGYDNNIGLNSWWATIAGGGGNNIPAGALYATIPGGQGNTATDYAFAAGNRAKAIHTGAFVWADSQDADFTSTETDQFLIRAGGGVGIGTTVTPVRLTVAGAGAFNAASAAALLLTNTTAGTGRAWEWHAMNNGRLQLADFGAAATRIIVETNGNVCIGDTGATNKLHVVGGATFASGSVGANQAVVWTPGSASWSFTSDRNAKEKIAPIDPQAVLEKVMRVPVAEWNYIGYDQRHVGPMAQDFHAQFPLDGDATTLNDADLHGVALAAIQGLNRKLQEQLGQKDAQLASLQQQIAGLLHRLGVIEEKLHASETK